MNGIGIGSFERVQKSQLVILIISMSKGILFWKKNTCVHICEKYIFELCRILYIHVLKYTALSYHYIANCSSIMF